MFHVLVFLWGHAIILASTRHFHFLLRIGQSEQVDLAIYDRLGRLGGTLGELVVITGSWIAAVIRGADRLGDFGIHVANLKHQAARIEPLLTLPCHDHWCVSSLLASIAYRFALGLLTKHLVWGKIRRFGARSGLILGNTVTLTLNLIVISAAWSSNWLWKGSLVILILQSNFRLNYTGHFQCNFVRLLLSAAWRLSCQILALLKAIAGNSSTTGVCLWKLDILVCTRGLTGIRSGKRLLGKLLVLSLLRCLVKFWAHRVKLLLLRIVRLRFWDGKDGFCLAWFGLRHWGIFVEIRHDSMP